MPITGKESLLKSLLMAAIKSAVEAKSGTPTAEPEYIDALSEGIANAIIPFLVTNTQVDPGQSVNVTSPTSGTVSSDGTIS